MELGLQEKVIIVTGGGSGIGASVVDKLSLIGATPVIIDKSNPDDTFYEIIRKRCPRAIWKTLDLCDDQDCKHAVEDILTKLSRIDGLVNNAGINDAVGIRLAQTSFENHSIEILCIITQWQIYV